MSNQLTDLLKAWHEGRDQTDWVLGTVYKTEGSAYRKAGAMMLINGFGQQFGLLSGGCLEADIMRNARKVMQTGKALTLVYDGSDEDDLSFQLGIGCGGTVYILLQPVGKGAEADLDLAAVYQALQERRAGTYYQRLPGAAGEVAATFKADEQRQQSRSVIEQQDDGADWLVTAITPEPHLLVIGGGFDARPVVSLAKELGWRVSLTDPRTANGRREHFPKADVLLKTLGPDLTDYVVAEKVDAVIVMSHSLEIDAKGLTSLQRTAVKHVALLGPRHRYFQVLERAGLAERDLTCPVSGPAGLPIGGQLPESIALSMLSECHAVLYGQRQAGQPKLKVAAGA